MVKIHRRKKQVLTMGENTLADNIVYKVKKRNKKEEIRSKYVR